MNLILNDSCFLTFWLILYNPNVFVPVTFLMFLRLVYTSNCVVDNIVKHTIDLYALLHIALHTTYYRRVVIQSF